MFPRWMDRVDDLVDLSPLPAARMLVVTNAVGVAHGLLVLPSLQYLFRRHEQSLAETWLFVETMLLLVNSVCRLVFCIAIVFPTWPVSTPRSHLAERLKRLLRGAVTGKLLSFTGVVFLVLLPVGIFPALTAQDAERFDMLRFFLVVSAVKFGVVSTFFGFSLRHDFRNDLVQWRVDDWTPARNIDRLDVFALTAKHAEELRDRVCAICLDPYQVGEKAMRLRCAHIFHEECLGKWLSRAGRCPLCGDDHRSR